MKIIAKAIGYASLAGTIVPPLLFMIKSMEHSTMQWIMLVCSLTWFAAAPFWMKAE